MVGLWIMLPSQELVAEWHKVSVCGINMDVCLAMFRSGDRPSGSYEVGKVKWLLRALSSGKLYRRRYGLSRLLPAWGKGGGEYGDRPVHVCRGQPEQG